MGLLNVSKGHWFSAFTIVPNTNNAICAATADDVGELVVEGKVGDGRGSIEGDFRSVGVLKIPDIRVGLHLVRSLLEARNGV